MAAAAAGAARHPLDDADLLEVFSNFLGTQDLLRLAAASRQYAAALRAAFARDPVRHGSAGHGGRGGGPGARGCLRGGGGRAPQRP